MATSRPFATSTPSGGVRGVSQLLFAARGQRQFTREVSGLELEILFRIIVIVVRFFGIVHDSVHAFVHLGSSPLTCLLVTPEERTFLHFPAKDDIFVISDQLSSQL